MFNFQGPIAKGKTSLSIAADGNMSYDAQTIVATHADRRDQRSGAASGRWRQRQRAARAGARARPAACAPSTRAATTRAAISASATSISPSAPTRPRRSTTRCACATRGRSARRCSASCASKFTQSRDAVLVGVDRADGSRARRVHVGRRRAVGRPRGPAVHGGAELRLHHRQAHAARRRAGRRRLVGQHDAVERQRHVHVLEPRRLPGGPAAAPITRRVGDPNVSYSQYEAGWYIQDDFRVEQEPQRQPRPASGSADQHRRQVEPRRRARRSPGRLRKGNVRGGYGMFYDWLDRTSTSRPCASTARIRSTRSSSIRRIPTSALAPARRCAASRIQLGPQLTQPTIHQASIGYDRPFGEWGNFRTDYMLTRATDTLRSVNVNAPHRRRASRPDGRQHHRDRVDRRARRRIASPSAMMLRVPEPPDHGQRDVSVRERPQLRGLAAGAAVEQQQSRCRLGSVGAWTSATACSSWPTRRCCYGVRASMQAQYSSAPPYTHHDRPRRQRRHGVQRSPGRRRPQQRARRVAVERQLPRQPLVQPRRPARRRPGDDRRSAATALRQRTQQRAHAAAPARAVVAQCRWS